MPIISLVRSFSSAYFTWCLLRVKDFNLLHIHSINLSSVIIMSLLRDTQILIVFDMPGAAQGKGKSDCNPLGLFILHPVCVLSSVFISPSSYQKLMAIFI